MTDALLFFAAIFTALTLSEFSPSETDPGGFSSSLCAAGVIEHSHETR